MLVAVIGMERDWKVQLVMIACVADTGLKII